MAGGAGAGAGVAGMGAILGGIGDIMQSAKYQRPTLPQPGGQEARLRQLAQSQLIGGGQQLLGGTALYNQMAPILMSQLPGMSYMPGSSSGGGDTSLGGVNSIATANSPLQSYSQSVAGRNNQQALQQQLTALKAQIKGTKPGGGRLKGLNQQQKQLQKQIKGLPNAGQLERQTYNAGTQQDPSMYNISMGSGPSSGGPPTSDQSLAQIRALMDQLGGNGSPDLSSLYNGAGGY